MNEAHKPIIGNEIPYRRTRLDKRTGSLVFDRHLDETLAEGSSSYSRAPDVDNPLARGQVT
ncbi:hypothetical protein [Novosphingobium sp. M1R2S20]|uniref:Uncharacterized protein n=1 Tax=Novosphingobium rhizovicinum TaxID=3228928 RepID=A0ABV3RF39_9SPHN